MWGRSEFTFRPVPCKSMNRKHLKAFDTLDQSIMLDKLTLLGLNRSAVQWFRSYLTMRTQSVCTNGVLSEPQPISFGVPQGSVLGPLLFIIYINDLPLAVQGCCVELYADDTLIFCYIFCYIFICFLFYLIFGVGNFWMYFCLMLTYINVAKLHLLWVYVYLL